MESKRLAGGSDMQSADSTRDMQNDDSQRDMQNAGSQKDMQNADSQRDMQIADSKRHVKSTDSQRDIQNANSPRDIHRSSSVSPRDANRANTSRNMQIVYSPRVKQSVDSQRYMQVDPVVQFTGIAPVLTDGKKYHVFFSYDIEDKNWVLDVIEKLKSNGFKCMHEDYFSPGRQMIASITEHIGESEKVVLVMSPAFLKNTQCFLEIDQGLVRSIEDGKMRLVPVMVRQCQVPDILKTLTYVDATSENYPWFERLVDALSTIETIEQESCFQNFTIQPRYGNMETLAKVSKSNVCLCSRYNQQKYQPSVLMRPEIQVPPTTFTEVIDMMETHKPCFCLWALTFDNSIFFAVLMTLFSMTTIFTFMNLMGTRDDGPLAIPILAPLACISLLFVIGHRIQRMLRMSRLKKAVENANEKLIDKNVIVGIVVEAAYWALYKTKMVFYYYNTTECMTQARRQMVEHSSAYTTAFNSGLLIPRLGTRHVRNAYCLCQFIEQSRYRVQ